MAVWTNFTCFRSPALLLWLFIHNIYCSLSFSLSPSLSLKTIAFYLFQLIVALTLVNGHGRLMNPPARNAMWRFGFPTAVNYNDNELFCGGYAGNFFTFPHSHTFRFTLAYAGRFFKTHNAFDSRSHLYSIKLFHFCSYNLWSHWTHKRKLHLYTFRKAQKYRIKIAFLFFIFTIVK